MNVEIDTNNWGKIYGNVYTRCGEVRGGEAGVMVSMNRRSGGEQPHISPEL